jgi:predicted dehydrogenase
VLGVGIVGAGTIANYHAEAYKRSKRAKIVAVCDSVEAKAEQKARKWGAKRYYTDYSKMLKDPDVDIVEVLTPHYLHKTMSIAALEAGKHVAVQKPMAMNLKECDEMISVAKRTGLKLKVFEHYLFYPPYIRAKELIERGEIGKPTCFRMKVVIGNLAFLPVWVSKELSNSDWKNDPTKYGRGSFMDGCYHHIAIARYFLGEISSVFAWIENLGTNQEVPAMVLMRHQDHGKYSILELNSSPQLKVEPQFLPVDERYEITGTAGYIWITYHHGYLMKTAPLITYKDGKTTYFDNIKSDFIDGFIGSVEQFLDAIIEDKKPVLTGEEGKRVLEIIFKIYESAEKERIISTI